MEKDWFGCWKELKKGMKRGYEEKLKNEYKESDAEPSMCRAGNRKPHVVELKYYITKEIRNVHVGTND